MHKGLMKLNKFFYKKADKFISLDFGQLLMKIVYMESAGQGYRLINYDLKNKPKLPEGRKEIIDFINSFLKNNSITARDTYLTISDVDSMLIKNLTLPNIPRTEILEAIKWQIKEEFLLDPGSYTLDWQNVRDYADEAGVKKKEVIFIAVKKATIDGYLSISGECNMNILGITDGPFNYANIIRRYGQEGQIIAIMDIGYNDTIICIYNNYRLDFIRRLTLSSDKLTQALTQSLISEKGKMVLSYETAENLKRNYGIPQEAGALLYDNIHAINVISLMRPLLENLLRELKYSFDYFIAGSNNQRPSVLYITGGGANLKNLDVYLNGGLNINVRKLPLPECVNADMVEKEKLDKDLNQILNAVGAGLSTEATIKFIPPEVKMQKIEFLEKVSLRLVTFTAGIILMFSFLMVQLQISYYKGRIKYAQAYLNTVGEIGTLDQALNPLEEAVSAIHRGKIPAERLLKLISAMLPANTMLDELSLDQDSHGLNLKGVVIASQKEAANLLGRLINKIAASPFFLSAELISSNARGNSREFAIDCQLAYE
jgi:type IV pilus assembly protein PilM